MLYDNFIIVHLSLHTWVLELHHDSVSSGHFGIKKTFELITRIFSAQILNNDIKKFVESCITFCKAKVFRLKPYSLLSLPFQLLLELSLV